MQVSYAAERAASTGSSALAAWLEVLGADIAVACKALPVMGKEVSGLTAPSIGIDAKVG